MADTSPDPFPRSPYPPCTGLSITPCAGTDMSESGSDMPWHEEPAPASRLDCCIAVPQIRDPSLDPFPRAPPYPGHPTPGPSRAGSGATGRYRARACIAVGLLHRGWQRGPADPSLDPFPRAPPYPGHPTPGPSRAGSGATGRYRPTRASTRSGHLVVSHFITTQGIRRLRKRSCAHSSCS